MSAHSTYDALRHFADSWGLLTMVVVFLVLCLWPFRRGARRDCEIAANMIFEKDNDDVG